MQQFQEYDNEGYNASSTWSRTLNFISWHVVKLRFMTCGEVFLFGLNNPSGSVYFYQLFKKQMAKAPHITISGIYKPMRDNVKYWQCSNIRVLCFKSLINWSFSRNHGNDVQLLFVHLVWVSDCFFFIFINLKSNVRFHYFHYWVNVLHSTNWRKRNGENCLHKTNLHKD